MTDQGTIWLTQEAYDKLQAELDDLKGPKRQEIIEKIAAARDEGDLKENSGYHAAKDDQGKQEARIRQLEDMLRRAEVGETPADDGIVEPGMVVTVDFGDGDTEKFLLGARENLSEGDTLDVYSPESAMGAAINGKPKGEKVTYTTPDVTSDLVSFEVTDDHETRARLDVRLGEDDVEATCRLRAFAEDHTPVGELAFTPVRGTNEVVIRTERRATTVEKLGCTAPGQPRPR